MVPCKAWFKRRTFHVPIGTRKVRRISGRMKQLGTALLYLGRLCRSIDREPTQSVCVADCYFIVNVLDLPFASPIAIYR